MSDKNWVSIPINPVTVTNGDTISLRYTATGSGTYNQAFLLSENAPFVFAGTLGSQPIFTSKPCACPGGHIIPCGLVPDGDRDE